MSDEADVANDRAAQDLERAIAAARHKVERPPAEECENDCGEKPRVGSRYCCPDCLADHQWRLALLKRQGVR
jgi:hypothetical protein